MATVNHADVVISSLDDMDKYRVFPMTAATLNT